MSPDLLTMVAEGARAVAQQGWVQEQTEFTLRWATMFDGLETFCFQEGRDGMIYTRYPYERR